MFDACAVDAIAALPLLARRRRCSLRPVAGDGSRRAAGLWLRSANHDETSPSNAVDRRGHDPPAAHLPTRPHTTSHHTHHKSIHMDCGVWTLQPRTVHSLRSPRMWYNGLRARISDNLRITTHFIIIIIIIINILTWPK